jgi:hypothetical protein
MNKTIAGIVSISKPIHDIIFNDLIKQHNIKKKLKTYQFFYLEKQTSNKWQRQ